MARLVKALALLAVLALAAYVFWPEAEVHERHLLETPAPSIYTVSINGRTWTINRHAGTAALAGRVRPLDPDRHERLWSRLADLHSPVWVEGLDPARLSSYGIDRSSGLKAADLDLAWGRKDGRGWIADLLRRRACAVDPAQLDRLDRLAARLDRRELLPPCDPHALQAGNLDLRRDDHGTWRLVGPVLLPPCTQRVAGLLSSLRAIPCEDPAAAPLPPDPSDLVIVLEGPVGRRLQVRLHTEILTTWIGVDDGPRQAVPATVRIPERLAALAENRPYDLATDPVASLERIEVTPAEGQPFRLVRSGNEDEVEGVSRWEVAWDGGRERASADVGRRFIHALAEVAIQATADDLTAPPTGPGLLVRILGERGLSTWFHCHDRQVQAPGWHGPVIRLPDLLRAPAAWHFQDPILFPLDPRRVVRLQRLAEDGPEQARGEVLRRTAQGWELVPLSGPRSRPLPQPVRTATPAMAGRLVEALRQARGRPIAPPSPASFADTSTITIAIESLATRPGSPSATLPLEDILDQELLFRFRPVDGGWQVLSLDGAAWSLDEATVQTLFAPLAERAVLPVAAWQVTAISVEGPAGNYRLVRTGADWRLEPGNRRAEAAAVRTWLQELASLSWQRAEPGTSVLPQGSTTTGRLLIETDAASGQKAHLLRLGSEQDGLCPCLAGPVEAAPSLIHLDRTAARRLLPAQTAFLPVSD